MTVVFPFLSPFLSMKTETNISFILSTSIQVITTFAKKTKATHAIRTPLILDGSFEIEIETDHDAEGRRQNQKRHRSKVFVAKAPLIGGNTGFLTDDDSERDDDDDGEDNDHGFGNDNEDADSESGKYGDEKTCKLIKHDAISITKALDDGCGDNDSGMTDQSCTGLTIEHGEYPSRQSGGNDETLEPASALAALRHDPAASLSSTTRLPRRNKAIKIGAKVEYRKASDDW